MKLELKHLAGYLPYRMKYEWSNSIYYYEHCSTRDFDYENSKPILRPLLDLTNEIEVNGEKFVPALRTQLHMFGRLPLKHDNIILLENRITTNTISYSDMQYLISLHFDVFKLIPAGLAIDINTL